MTGTRCLLRRTSGLSNRYPYSGESKVQVIPPLLVQARTRSASGFRCWSRIRFVETTEEDPMAVWSSAHLEEIDEISDGRVPWRPLRAHFGVSSFGANVFTG